MIIKDGCYYKRRDGKVVGPVKRICDVEWYAWTDLVPYRKDGKANLSGWGESPLDLIGELQDGAD